MVPEKSAFYKLNQIMDTGFLQYHNRKGVFPESRMCYNFSTRKIQVFNCLFIRYQKQIRQSIRKIDKYVIDSEGFRYSLLFCRGMDVLNDIISQLRLKNLRDLKL